MRPLIWYKLPHHFFKFLLRNNCMRIKGHFWILVSKQLKWKNIQTKMVPHILWEDLVVYQWMSLYLQFDIRDCKIWYGVKGHYHLVNQSNECRLFFLKKNNNLIVTTIEKRDLNSSSPNKEEKVMPLN